LVEYKTEKLYLYETSMKKPFTNKTMIIMQVPSGKEREIINR